MNHFQELTVHAEGNSRRTWWWWNRSSTWEKKSAIMNSTVPEADDSIKLCRLSCWEIQYLCKRGTAHCAPVNFWFQNIIWTTQWSRLGGFAGSSCSCWNPSCNRIALRFSTFHKHPRTDRDQIANSIQLAYYLAFAMKGPPLWVYEYHALLAESEQKYSP